MKKILSKIFIFAAFAFAIFGNILASEINPVFQTQQSTFQITEITQKISETISDNLKNDMMAVRYGFLSREGSEKSFSFDEAERSGITDDLRISEINIDKENKNFEALLASDKSNYNLIAKGKYTESRRVPVAASFIKKNQIIDESQVIFKSVPEERILKASLNDINLIVGKAAAKNIIKGTQFLTTDVENPVVIKKGKAVVAIYKLKNMEVKLTAVALADGREGEVIKLKNLESGKEFLAMAEKQNTAIVNFTELQVADNNVK